MLFRDWATEFVCEVEGVAEATDAWEVTVEGVGRPLRDDSAGRAERIVS
jgi:hypothetical protein